MGLTSGMARRAGLGVQAVGGLSLISYADTKAFLDACKASGVVVLGIEGFYLENGQVHPEMNAIADFSQLTDCEDSVVEARAFIEDVGQPGMLFDFALSEVPTT